MRVSKKRLLEIVREEVAKLDLTELNPSHIPAGRPGAGRFTKRGAGSVYSLTKNAEEEIGNSSTLKVQRGMETSSGKVQSKFGMNGGDPKKECGRLTIDGNPKSITRSCSNYPKNYWDRLDEIISQLELKEGAAEKEICDRCIQNFLARLNRANAAVKNAQSGKQPKPVEEDATANMKRPKSHYRGSPIDPNSRKSDSRKKAERTKAQRRRAGVYVEPFSRAEKSLLNPNSLRETTSSNPDKADG